MKVNNKDSANSETAIQNNLPITLIFFFDYLIIPFFQHVHAILNLFFLIFPPIITTLKLFLIYV